MSRLLLLSRIRQNIIAYPARDAIEAAELILTYSQLGTAIHEMESRLSSLGVGSGSVVALSMNPSPHLVVAMIACAELGATYLPMDPRHDSARIARIMDIAKPCIIIKDAPESSYAFTQIPPNSSNVGTPAEDILYVIFTSGTTGAPKGVCISPSSLDALFVATEELFSFDKADRWLLAHSPAFDFSVWEIWMPLATGGTLVIADSSQLRDPAALTALIYGRKITVLNQTPTAFLSLSQYMSVSGVYPDRLRYIIFGGEKLLRQHIADWAANHGLLTPKLINMYGITEVTVHATHQEIQNLECLTQGSLIGRPLPGFVPLVLNADGEDAHAGELYLSGPQLAIGYLGDELATRSVFIERDGCRFYRTGDLVEVDSAGNLAYTGRRDRQVKISGHRIELSEVEQALKSHPAVTGTIAFVHTTTAGTSRIVCGFTSNESGDIASKHLRELMRGLLPGYMMPSEFVRLTRIPTNVNGKADISAIEKIWKQSRLSFNGGGNDEQS